jgi:Skp family chaperone for outer membrane proteins
MKKLVTLFTILTIVGLTSSFAQSYYVCGDSSTDQQCQDANNIDTLRQQLPSAQGAVQTISSQLQALGANLQAQLVQAQQSVQNIQSEIQSNEADYDNQTFQTQIASDSSALQTRQANNLAGKSSMGAKTNGT